MTAPSVRLPVQGWCCSPIIFWAQLAGRARRTPRLPPRLTAGPPEMLLVVLNQTLAAGLGCLTAAQVSTATTWLRTSTPILTVPTMATLLRSVSTVGGVGGGLVFSHILAIYSPPPAAAAHATFSFHCLSRIHCDSGHPFIYLSTISGVAVPAT